MHVIIGIGIGALALIAIRFYLAHKATINADAAKVVADAKAIEKKL